jgi:hypothetical protein
MNSKGMLLAVFAFMLTPSACPSASQDSAKQAARWVYGCP